MAYLLSFSLPKPTLPRASAACFPSTASDSTSTSTSSLIESLDQKFGRRGIKFAESGDVPIVELSVRNGSSVNLRIPDAHVTSYKPKVYWKDDGFEEILYTTTTPAGGNNGAIENATAARARGGIGVVINEVPEANPKGKVKGGAGGGGGGGSLLADSEWFVKNSDSDSFDAVQVELGCTSGKLDITYVVSLYPLSVATAVIVQNNGPKPINLTSAILTHFRFKRRSGAGATDLKGCSFTAYPPLPSPFEILSPFEAMKADDPGWFSFGSEPVAKPGVWAQQEEMITVLKHKLSRVYGAPPSERTKSFHRSSPSKYEILDQGRELFFRVIRMGYEEIYLSSPGSFSKKYGNDYFVCTGPASMLVPVTVNPGEEWRGAQVIEHDNL